MGAPTPFRSPPPPLVEGVYRALDERPHQPPALAAVNGWPLTAALYEPLWRRRSMGILTRGAFTVARELELMITALAPRPGERILDAACSAALYARTLAAAVPGAELHAVDTSLPFLRRAARYADAEGVTLTLVLADVARLPYRDESFQALTCGGSLNEFSDPVACLAEFARVLEPGGRMWQMYLPRADGPLGRALQAPARATGVRFLAPAALAASAAEAGFTLVRAQYRGPVAMALFRKVEAR